MRIGAMQDDGREHPDQLDVIDVRGGARDQPGIFVPLDSLANKLGNNWHRGFLCDGSGGFRGTHLGCRVLHSLDDVLIAGASAQIALERGANFVVRGTRIALQQISC